MMDAAERGVVEDALGTWREWGETSEAVHCGGGFAAGAGHPVGVQDDAAAVVFGAGGDEYELDAEGLFAVALEVQVRVGFVADGQEFTG